MPHWFDAHLDLGYLAVNGRDMLAPVETCKGPHLPAAITLPSMREAGVRHALGTIFTETGGEPPVGYPEGDPEAAHRAGVAQLEWYRSMVGAGHLRRLRAGDRGDIGDPRAAAAPAVGILIENADPIRSPEELLWWVERGVVAVGMAWWKPSRYAGGNRSKSGLTELGRELVRAADALGVVHDLSHLSQHSVDEVLAQTERPVIASHSNCRALLGGEGGRDSERHLADAAIEEIGRRGGVVGLNLYRGFLRESLAAGERPSVEDAVRHVEHVCEVMGHRRGVGLGSDMDGGFSAHEMCEGIEHPRDLARLGNALANRGWSDEEIADFTHRNWLRLFGCKK